MYIFKNAFRCIARSKGRSILIGLVVLLLSVSACIGLSIKEANRSLQKQYADDMEISATLNSRDMRGNRSLSLDTLKEFSENDLVKNFYYTASAYFAANENIEPLDVSGSFEKNKGFKEKYGDVKDGEKRTETEQRSETTFTPGDMPQGGPGMPPGGFSQGGTTTNNTFITNNIFYNINMASMNDFTVMAYSSEAAVPEYISSLNVLDLQSEELNCVISKSLAEENELEVGSTFSLKNPDNEEEIYTFTIVGIADTSESSDSQDTSSNAAFTDNFIHISQPAFDSILANSQELNPIEETTETESGESDSEEAEETEETQTSSALTGSYSGTFIFANLDNYNAFNEALGDDYRMVSEDVQNYEQQISQLETLGEYAGYFLIVIFIIGAFVLVIINLFSIRNRKYEIGVLTAIGMKKIKVAIQFVLELFVITFVALIIGSAIGGVTSVPITNKLLTDINSAEETEMSGMPGGNPMGNMPDNLSQEFADNSDNQDSGVSENKNMPRGDMPENINNFGESFMNQFANFRGNMNQYITQISSATDLHVILQMILIGIGLTLISSVAAVLFVMRYEPLKILNNRD